MRNLDLEVMLESYKNKRVHIVRDEFSAIRKGEPILLKRNNSYIKNHFVLVYYNYEPETNQYILYGKPTYYGGIWLGLTDLLTQKENKREIPWL